MTYQNLNNLSSLNSLGTQGVGVSSPPFNPNSIPGLVLWFEADKQVYSDAGVTPATNGSTVQQWNDQSASAVNMSQATSASRPTYNTNQQNGLPLITGDGVDDFMKTGVITVSQPTTVFLAFKYITFVPKFQIIDGLISSGLQFRMDSSAPTIGIFAGGTFIPPGTVATAGAFQIMTGIFNGASSAAQTNNGAKGITANVGTNSSNGITLFARPAPDRFTNASVGEILVYNSALSDSDSTNVARYLGGKWGIAVS